MTADKEKIIEKLKKLFALGNSPNQHEAELAMKKASELMTEYQVNMTEIDLSEEGAAVKEDFDMKGADYDRRIWVAVLAQSCAKLYDAECYSVSGKGWVQRFYGTPVDIAAAKMTLEHLYKSWRSIVEHDWFNAINRADPDVSKMSFKASHGQGFACAIGRRIDQLVKERQAKVLSATGRDLVVVKSAAINDLRAGQKTRTKRNGSDVDPNAFNAGRQRGEVIPLHGGIEKSGATLAIGCRRSA